MAANILMLYTGAPQNTRRKEISELNIEAGWEYAKKAGIERSSCMHRISSILPTP